LPVALSKCPSVRILIVPVNLGVRRADRPTDVPREALVGRQVVPVLVAALDVRVRVARRVRVATVSRAGSVEMAMVMTVDRVLVEMTVGPVATVSRAVLDVMAMVRIVPVVMARVRVARRVRVAMVSRADHAVMVSRADHVVRVMIVDLVATVSRAVVVAMVMVRIVRVVMARVRVVRRVRVARVSRADLAVTTTVAVVTSFVGRVSPATKPNVDAWRCAPKVAAPLARISSRRAKSACPNNGSTKVRWTRSNCVTPPKRRPSALLGKPARMANSIPR